MQMVIFQFKIANISFGDDYNGWTPAYFKEYKLAIVVADVFEVSGKGLQGWDHYWNSLAESPYKRSYTHYCMLYNLIVQLCFVQL